MLTQVNVNVIEKNTIIKTYKADVNVDRFNEVLANCTDGIVRHAEYALNTKLDYQEDDKIKYKASADKVADIVNNNIEVVIAGGAILDVLTNSESKDIDVLFLHPGAEKFMLHDDNGNVVGKRFIDFTGWTYFYDKSVFGEALSRPFVYTAFEQQVVICYKKVSKDCEIKYDVDFLFGKRIEGTILDNIEATFDQTAKLGYYKDGEFYISIDMYNAMKNKQIAFNTKHASKSAMTDKEVKRLEEASVKYGYKITEPIEQNVISKFPCYLDSRNI